MTWIMMQNCMVCKQGSVTMGFNDGNDLVCDSCGTIHRIVVTRSDSPVEWRIEATSKKRKIRKKPKRKIRKTQ
jgi:hypothetical protein